MNNLHIVATLLLKNNNDLPTTKADPAVFSTVVYAVLALLGAIAFLVMVISGFLYSTSQGDPAKVARAKNAIIYAAVGLIVAALAATIVRFVLGKN